MNLATHTYSNNRLAPQASDLQALWGFVPTDHPNIRSYEDLDNYYVQIDLPGVRKEDVKIRVEEDTLKIEATRQVGRADQVKSVTYQRNFSLSEDVQFDKISAEQKDGVLSLTLPKKEETKPRTVNISVN